MNCLDQATGTFSSSRFFNYVNADGYQTVAASPFVDGVFVAYPQTLPVNSAGVQYTLLPGDDSGQSDDYITDNREPMGTGPIVLDGVTYSSGVGIHAAAGVTFNLAALDAANDTDFNFFSADFGRIVNSIDIGVDRGYVVFSDATLILSSYISPLMAGNDPPTEFRLPIPSDATYLTLIAGTGGDGMGYDHTGFGDATLTTTPAPEPSTLALLGGGAICLLTYGWRKRLAGRRTAQPEPQDDAPAILSFPSQSFHRAHVKRRAA
jgi:hypothetical protein